MTVTLVLSGAVMADTCKKLTGVRGNPWDKNRSEKHKHGLRSSSLIRITHPGRPGYDEFSTLHGCNDLFGVGSLIICACQFVSVVAIRTRNVMIREQLFVAETSSVCQVWPEPGSLKGRWEERRWVDLNPPQIIAFFVVNLSQRVMISVWVLSKSGLLQTQTQRESGSQE